MDTSDANNPFDPATYKTTSLKSMIALRAFCADYFDQRIRNRTDTPKEEIACFLALINHSPDYFARARAVIPELRASGNLRSDVGSDADKVLVQALVSATRGVRGREGREWEVLPEEGRWRRLVRDGREDVEGEDGEGEDIERDLANLAMGNRQQVNDASASDSPINPTVLALGNAGYNPSDAPLRPETSKARKNNSFLEKLGYFDIKAFVPQVDVESEELDGSLTSGSCQRRPDEIDQGVNALPSFPLQFDQMTVSKVPPAKSIRPHYLFHGCRGFVNFPKKGRRHSDSTRMSLPSPQNPSAAWSQSDRKATPSRERVESLLGPRPDNTIEFLYTDPAYANSPSQHAGSGLPLVRGVGGVRPFSAARRTPGYETLHEAGQRMFRKHLLSRLGASRSRNGTTSSRPFQGQPNSYQSTPGTVHSPAFQDEPGQYQPRPNTEPQPNPYQSIPGRGSFYFFQIQPDPHQSRPDVTSHHPFQGQPNPYQSIPGTVHSHPFQSQPDPHRSISDMGSSHLIQSQRQSSIYQWIPEPPSYHPVQGQHDPHQSISNTVPSDHFQSPPNPHQPIPGTVFPQHLQGQYDPHQSISRTVPSHHFQSPPNPHQPIPGTVFPQPLQGQHDPYQSIPDPVPDAPNPAIQTSHSSCPPHGSDAHPPPSSRNALTTNRTPDILTLIDQTLGRPTPQRHGPPRPPEQAPPAGNGTLHPPNHTGPGAGRPHDPRPNAQQRRRWTRSELGKDWRGKEDEGGGGRVEGFGGGGYGGGKGDWRLGSRG